MTFFRNYVEGPFGSRGPLAHRVVMTAMGHLSFDDKSLFEVDGYRMLQVRFNRQGEGFPAGAGITLLRFYPDPNGIAQVGAKTLQPLGLTDYEFVESGDFGPVAFSVDGESDPDGVPDVDDNCDGDFVSTFNVVDDADPGPSAFGGCSEIFCIRSEQQGLGDNDGDGIANRHDNCSNHPNPEHVDLDKDGFGFVCDKIGKSGLRVTGPQCNESLGNCPPVPNFVVQDEEGDWFQPDADDDGVGDACGTDANDNGATDLNDVSEVNVAANAVSTDPRYDFNCNGAADINDVIKAYSDAQAVTVPGPSGLPCAGTIPCSAP